MSIVSQHEINSFMLNQAWEYMVYIPEGYDVAKLPILYLLHGASHPVNVWFDKGNLQSCLDTAIKNNIIKPMIVITPYSLQNGFSWYVNQENFPYETAFIKEFVPAVESLYGGLRDRKDRNIGGSSMGGYGSLRFSLIYPEMFQSALLIAPAIWDDISEKTIPQHPYDIVFQPFQANNAIWNQLLYHNYIDAYKDKNTSVQFYISAGDRDFLYLEYYAAKLHHVFRMHNIPSILRICDGDHGDWNYYPKAVIDGLACLLSSPQ